MIIRHLSDLHSSFPEPTQEFDITILSGDIFPDFLGYGKQHSAQQQEHWLKRNRNRIEDWYRGKPCFYIHGNHDFLNDNSLARETGAININDSFAITDDESLIYGFPWIPNCGGNWEYGLSDLAMLAAVETMLDDFKEVGYPTILVTHSPPYGILDKSYMSLGNVRLTNALSYSFPENCLPKALLCGHIHENSCAPINLMGMIVSNAACTQNYIEVLQCIELKDPTRKNLLISSIGNVERLCRIFLLIIVQQLHLHQMEPYLWLGKLYQNVVFQGEIYVF